MVKVFNVIVSAFSKSWLRVNTTTGIVTKLHGISNFNNLILILLIAASIFAIKTYAFANNNQLNNSQTSAHLTENNNTPHSSSDIAKPATIGESSSTNSVNISSHASPAQSSTEVSVDGESVAVPENGSYHKTIVKNNSTTTIDSTNTSSGNGSTNSNFSSSVQTHTFSSGSNGHSVARQDFHSTDP